MISQPKHKDLAIITKTAVAKTFDGIACRLLRRIQFVRYNYGHGSRTYIVRTDLVRYVESEEVVYDANNQSSIQKKNRLIAAEQREDWAEKTYSYKEIIDLDALISKQLPTGLTRPQKDMKEMQLGLLALTKKEKAWGIDPAEWIAFNSADIIQDIQTP